MTASIIMPCFNAAPYIAEAIRSCLNQTVKSELVIINDASTDSSEAIIEWFQERNPQIVSIKTFPNKGPAHAMNLGIREASGDIICFAAADDVQEPNKVEVILEAMKSAADFCYTGYYHASTKAVPSMEVHPLALSPETIKSNTCCSGGAIAMKREVAVRTPFREELKVNEDMALLVDLYKAKLKYAMVDIPTFRYRLLQTGMSYARKGEVEEITRKLSQEL